MKLSLINVDTITDAKLPTLNEITMHDHATFITQTDINSEQHRKMIEYDDNYIWNFIPKNNQEEKCRQRVAIRIPRNCREDVFFEPVEHSYIIGRVKKSIKDPSGAQWYFGWLKMKHIRLKTMIIYRTPDATTATDNQLFEDIRRLSPQMAMGDMNINWKDENLRNKLKREIPFMKQIVNKFTRFGVGRNLESTKTCIDHVYVRPNWAKKFKYRMKDVDRSLTDHRTVQVDIDIKIPPVN